MARRIRASDVVEGLTLRQYVGVKARLDLDAARAQSRGIKVILAEIDLDVARWHEVSEAWAQRLDDAGGSRNREDWLRKRLPAPVAYGLAYSLAVERELATVSGAPADKHELEAEQSEGEPPGASEEGSGVRRDTLPRPGERIGLQSAGGGRASHRDQDAVVSPELPPPRPPPPRREPVRPSRPGERIPSVADPPPRYQPLVPSTDPRVPTPPERRGFAPVVAPEPASLHGHGAAGPLGRLDPDGGTVAGASIPSAEPLPFTPPVAAPEQLRLDPDGDTVVGVEPAAGEALPFAPPGSAAGSSDHGRAPTTSPQPAGEEASGRLDPDGATAVGVAPPQHPPLPFDADRKS